jgi:hypothetical protein
VLYFTADDGLHGRGLWRSDGTAAGTVRLGATTVEEVRARLATARAAVPPATVDLGPEAVESGTWSGQTAQNAPYRLLVSNQCITQLRFGGTTSNCTFETTVTPGNGCIPITNDAFSRSGSGGCPSYSTSGSFAGTTASGSLSFNFTNPACGCVGGGSTTWNAALVPPMPTVSIEDRTVHEGNVANAAFRVVLSTAFPQNVTVSFGTSSFSASAGSDYTATSGTLTFTPGRTSHSVFVPILADAVAEGTETFFVSLSNPTNATIDHGQATGTIHDPLPPAEDCMLRAYNFTADYHFFTTSLGEFNNAVASGYRNEAVPCPFHIPNTQLAGTAPVFRMYNPNNGRHYYTVSAVERDSLRSGGWTYEKDEGFMWTAAASGTVEIFRLYNTNSGTHLYTTSAAEKDHLVATFPGIWVQHASLGFALP